MTALAPTLQAFFTDRLITQRHASAHTIRCYRDTMRLLLTYAQHQLHAQPAELDMGALDADLISAFLDHLEHERQNTIGTRNTRLAAIHSLYKFAGLKHPEHAATIARVLAIPPKRHDRRLITHLDEKEIQALLAAPDPTRWIGRRDRAMFQLAIETGLRVSELTDLRCGDIHTTAPAHVACRGKDAKSASHR
jgi:integrase/recombinase XerD